MKLLRLFATILLCFPLFARAGEDSITAIARDNGTNFKDRALAACISTAYQGSPAGDDADITKSAFLEWTYYDDGKGNAAVDRLVTSYLRRDYSNPVEGYAGSRFDLLKCIDLYHSKELEAQVKKYVPNPGWIGDKPPAKHKR